MNEKEEKVSVASERAAQTKRQLFWEIFRFLLVGGLATLADYIVFWLFDGVLFPLFPWAGSAWQGISLALSTAFGFVVGLIVNWLLSISFVFREVTDKEKASSKNSFVIFTIIGLIGLGLTELGIFILVTVLPEITLFGATLFLGTSWRKWVSKVIMTCIVLVFNYIGRKIFIFK